METAFGSGRVRRGYWGCALLGVIACSGSSKFNEVGEVTTGQGGSGGANIPDPGSGGSGGSSGKGGSGGTGKITPVAGWGGDRGGAGAGGTAPEACDAGNGCLFAAGTDVRAIAADGDRLYWVEYGTEDELGNYLDDGKLMARAFDSEEVVNLASDLAGPVGVNVSTAHVYVYLDQYYQSGTTSALARVPIAGGEAEVVQMGAEPRTFGGSICEHACFAASGGRGFWSKGGAVFVIDPDPGAQPIEIVPAMDVGELSLDDTHLYFSTFVELRRVPLAGGPSEFVTVLPLDGAESLFMHPRVGPDFIYAVESVENVDPEKHYLATIPKVDAPWTRIANLPSGTSKLQIIGGGYFLDTFAGSNGNTSQITHASLSEPMNQTNLVAVPTETKFIWTGSRVGAFWSEGRNIYFRATNSD